MRNDKKSIRPNPFNSETSIRMNPNPFETNFSIQINLHQSDLGLIQTEFSIRINPKHSDLGFIQTHADWEFGFEQSGFGLIWIENLVSVLVRIHFDWFAILKFGSVLISDVSELIVLSRIDFWQFFINRDTKRFSNWFKMIRIGLDTDTDTDPNKSVPNLKLNYRRSYSKPNESALNSKTILNPPLYGTHLWINPNPIRKKLSILLHTITGFEYLIWASNPSESVTQS